MTLLKHVIILVGRFIGRVLPKEASHHVLKQASGLGFDELSNHITQDGANSIEALIRGTDVVQTIVV